MVVAWHLGKRDRVNTEDFVSKIRLATTPGYFEISTDAFAPYENAIDAGLYDRASHSNVVKLFSHHVEEGRERYSPGHFVCVQKDAVSGNPDLDRAGTSHVERKNGTLRQWCKRLTRLTYAFSKKWDNLKMAWPCTSHITTFAGFTARCGSRLRWRQASRIMCGAWEN